MEHPPKGLLIALLRKIGKRVGLRYFLCVWLFDQIAMSQSINLIVTAINQSINLSSKQGTEGGHIFPKGKKNLLFIFVSEEDHLGLQIRRNEQVLRCQGR